MKERHLLWHYFYFCQLELVIVKNDLIMHVRFTGPKSILKIHLTPQIKVEFQ